MSTKITNIILAFMLAFGSASVTYGQEYISTPVTISKEKVRVNGKVCYSHIVREKQTLFSIAKAYSVTVDDIYSFNPSLKETGLKKNAIILIPSAEALSAAAQPAGKPAATEPDAETVQEQDAEPQNETKAEADRKASEDVQPAQPAQDTKKKPDAQVRNASSKKQKTHTVKWYEDLDVIAEKYGVTVEAIMMANNLTGRKLSKRQKLIIPEPGETPEVDFIYTETEAETEVTENEESTLADADTITVMTGGPDPEWLFAPKDEVNVTLILPMKASTESVSRNNMDFYSGVLLAVKDLADAGISTQLNVYDSSDETHPIVSEDIDESDLIIGPVSSTDLRMLLESDTDPRMVISPLDSRAEELAYRHSNFIQVPTPQMSQYKDIMNWIREDYMPGDTLIMIKEKTARQTDGVKQMIQAADSSGLTFIPFSYSILEGRDITEPLTSLMTATGVNRVVIASESEAFVNDVVRNLSILLYNKLNVVLYAPARIRNFETIEVENLHKTAAHISLGYLIDYDSQQVKNFLLKYRALYNTEPTQYAFQGYDIATYFIGMCGRYGSHWTRKLDDEQTQMLQSTFMFVPAENGGYVNQGIRRLVYGDEWSVIKTR
ncbi:MAG: LysM peptidoglycan-binding domain-containing protein [Bacteroidales bacterium]|nr:LysM peptidoglycan-binding domain-containing protein [Bacteroidales bacterium]